MLKYDPSDAKKTKELLDEGEYAALIEDVTPRVSKAAEKRGETAPNMLELVLRVEGRKIWDYITFPTGLWKLEQIATMLGESDAFTAGTFDLEKKIGATVNVYLRAKSDSFGVKMQVGVAASSSKVADRASCKTTIRSSARTLSALAWCWSR